MSGPRTASDAEVTLLRLVAEKAEEALVNQRVTLHDAKTGQARSGVLVPSVTWDRLRYALERLRELRDRENDPGG